MHDNTDFLFTQNCHYIVKFLQKLRTYFLVVVRLPFMKRVEVETDLKLPIPPPRLSIPSRPPKEEEKEVNSAKREKKIVGEKKNEMRT